MHPFFVSVTEIKHNEKEKVVQISSKVFTDDFEKALKAKYRVGVDLVNPADKKKQDLLIADYMSKHLVLKINGKTVACRYLGYQIEQEAAWCFLEVQKVNHVNVIEVNDSILFDEHPSQTNLLHVTVKGDRQSTKLDNPDKTAVFKF